MDTQEILNKLDAEIARLQQVRSLLAGSAAISVAVKKRGRPTGPGASASAPAVAKGKRTLSAEARARIAAAQKLRWAKTKQGGKTAARPAPKKSAPAKKAIAPKKQAPVEAPETLTD